MSELLRRTLGEGVEMETIIAPDLWNTLADPAQVESAMLNLAINARDAMPAGGRLTIKVDNTALGVGDVDGAHDARAGEYVSIEVRDTGEGMTATTRERAFEPFFTTKPDGKGSGLGLSMAYGFVRQSGGYMQLESEPGQGSAVRIYLPRSTDPLTPVTAPVARTAELPDATILVVEDESQVRAASVAMLRGLGYRCLETDSAAAALAVLETRPDVDLVFTDVIMPGAVKTREFAARIRELAPGTPILFTSGYARDAIASHDGTLDEGVALLPKPYARDELAARIGQLLSEAREAKASALA
jgi:CheY-like chemotaxis protein